MSWAMSAATTQMGNRKFVGGEPPASLYKWARAADVGGDATHRRRPDFYTGESTCKGFGAEKVLLVEKASSYHCDRGCTFD